MPAAEDPRSAPPDGRPACQVSAEWVGCIVNLEKEQIYPLVI